MPSTNWLLQSRKRDAKLFRHSGWDRSQGRFGAGCLQDGSWIGLLCQALSSNGASGAVETSRGEELLFSKLRIHWPEYSRCVLEDALENSFIVHK